MIGRQGLFLTYTYIKENKGSKLSVNTACLVGRDLENGLLGEELIKGGINCAVQKPGMNPWFLFLNLQGLGPSRSSVRVCSRLLDADASAGRCRSRAQPPGCYRSPCPGLLLTPFHEGPEQPLPGGTRPGSRDVAENIHMDVVAASVTAAHASTSF